MASFNKVVIEGVRSAPDRIYYNGTVINNSQFSNQDYNDPNVVFQDQRQTGLVPDSANYELSVENFSLNGCSNTLPVFIPQIEPPTITNEIDQVTLTGLTGNPRDGFSSVKFDCVSAVTLKAGNVIDLLSGFPTNLSFLNTGNITVESANSTSFTVILAVPVALNSPTPYTFSAPKPTAQYGDPEDVTTTIYKVSIGIYNGTTYSIVSKPVIWQPENSVDYIPIPKTANPVQEESQYYYSYNYTHWISLINKALNTAWNEAIIVFTGDCGTQCPFFEYDETTGLFSINQDSQTSMIPWGTKLPDPYGVAATVPTSAFGGTYQTDEYSFVGMNINLENLFGNFDFTYFDPTALWASQAGVFLPEAVINTGLPVDLLAGNPLTDLTPVGVTLRTQPRTSIFQLVNPFTGLPIQYAFFARLPQDFISTGTCWSPIASLVLGTTQIPVRNEATANPIVLGSSNSGGQTSSSGAFQKVLIETPINALRADIYRGFILYEPTTLTYSSLEASNSGISNIDVILYWRNRLTNSLIPVQIPNQGSMSFRLLFKKKYIV